MKRLKIVHISSEIAPFSKTGGLGDVARSLPKALRRLGHDVIAITPLYGKVIDIKKSKLKCVYKNIDIYLNSEDHVRVNFWLGYLMDGLPVYFVENKKYFSGRKTLYGSTHENVRFMIFNVASLKLLSLLKFDADIVHCHDWQTGLIPFYLKTDFRYSKTLKNAKTIYTIHNLVFQFGKNWWEVPLEHKDYGRKRLPHISDPEVEYINFAKRGILSADAISTVSEQYRDEILTRHFGQDLHRILGNRQDRLFGIVNGIDYNVYNPLKDKNLIMNYNYLHVDRKKKNKEALQKKFGLPVDLDLPVLVTTSRLTFQKGFELISRLIHQLMLHDLQLIIIGAGDKQYVTNLTKLAKKYPDKLAVIPSHEENQKYETLALAGADIFLLPSHHEPCGINQLIAMRYGCIPVVRRVGGLSDTVNDFDPKSGKGTGFVFDEFKRLSFYGAIVRALEIYRIKPIWKNVVIRAMKQSNSWEIPAKRYERLYHEIIKQSDDRQQKTENRK